MYNFAYRHKCRRLKRLIEVSDEKEELFWFNILKLFQISLVGFRNGIHRLPEKFKSYIVGLLLAYHRLCFLLNKI